MAALEPYHFEPERASDASEDSGAEDNDLERLLNKSWCSCRDNVSLCLQRGSVFVAQGSQNP